MLDLCHLFDVGIMVRQQEVSVIWQPAKTEIEDQNDQHFYNLKVDNNAD